MTLCAPGDVRLTIDPPTETRFSPLLYAEDIQPVLMHNRKKAIAECRLPVEFIINTRDGPYLPRGTVDTPIVLSQYTSSRFDDLPIALSADWAANFPYLHFPHHGYRPTTPVEPVPWAQRLDACVFRGTATGFGHTERDNVRIQAASMRNNVLDIQLTGLNNKRLKLGADGLGFVSSRERFSRDAWLSMQQQAQYKLQLILPGNVGAGRIGAALSTGSCLLITDHNVPQCEIFYHMLPNVHYVPIRADLSDLEGVVRGLLADNERCQLIGDAGRRLWEQQLCTEALVKRTRTTIASLPAADDAVFFPNFDHVFFKCRSATYCLMDRHSWELKLFVPFVNDKFKNNWPQPFKLQRGLSMRDLFGPGVLTDERRWWQNANLVCNIPAKGLQGDSQLPQMQSLLQQIARFTF